MRVMLETTEPAGAVERAPKISDSSLPAASQLQPQVGTLPVMRTAKAHKGRVGKSGSSSGDLEQEEHEIDDREADDTNEEHQADLVVATDSDSTDESELSLIDVQVHSPEDEARHGCSEKSDPALDVRS